jgi:hypothetical protein
VLWALIWGHEVLWLLKDLWDLWLLKDLWGQKDLWASVSSKAWDSVCFLKVELRAVTRAEPKAVSLVAGKAVS